jgi:hypothetical protein
MRPRVVELVQDVGVDAPRAPFAVVKLRPRRRFHGHVVGVDLGRDPVEEDAPLAFHRSALAGEQLRRQLLHHGAAVRAAGLFAAVGHLE